MTTTTTAATLTDEQIHALRDEAASVGDTAQVLICRVALDEPACPLCGLELDEEDRCPLGQDARHVGRHVMTPAEARAECARVLRRQTMTTTSRRTLETLTYHVAQEDQGQMIEIAYAADEESERVIRRTTDRSTGAVTYEGAPADMLVGDFAPWNGAPEIDGDWRAL